MNKLKKNENLDLEVGDELDVEIRSGMAFLKLVCLRCGTPIIRSALHDPYLCRQCEKEMEPQKRFAS